MRCPPPPCRRWCPPNVRRRAAQCGASCWLQVAQNMSEDAIVESLHNVFSRPMALVRIARINAACCKRVTRGCRCGGKSLPPWALPAPQLLLLMPRTMRGLCDPLPLFLFCPVLHSSVLLQSSHALSAQVWLRCCTLLRAQCKSDTALGEGESSPCVSEGRVMMRMQEACVMALLLWASAWSGAAGKTKGGAAACSVVAQFLENCFVLVHIPSLLHVSRDHWHADDGCWDGISAVWLEQSESSIKWTVICRQEQQQQQQQSISQAITLKSIEKAVNDFPQFPALRSLGDPAHAVHYRDMQRVSWMCDT